MFGSVHQFSDAIDFRLYLTDQQFKARVRRSRAWATYLSLPPMPPFLTNRLSWLKSPKECYEGRIKLAVDYVKQELGRLKAHYEERTADDRFYASASDVSRRFMAQSDKATSTACHPYAGSWPVSKTSSMTLSNSRADQ